MAIRAASPAFGALCLLLPLFSIGCGGEEPSSYATPTPSAQEGNVFDFNGTFVRKTQIAQYVQNAIISSKYDYQTVVTYSVVTMKPGSNSTTALYTERDCVTDMSEVSGSVTYLSDGFFANQEIQELTVNLSDNVVGSTIEMPQQVELKGVNLSDPLNDPLPTSIDDERIYDYDVDTYPGFTIDVEGALDGWFRAIERYVYSWSGTLVTADDISGSMVPTLEDVLLESSSALLPTDTDVQPDSDPTHHFFEMHRVADGYTCDELIANRTTLFPE